MIGYLAQFPHYRRHLNPIIRLLEELGVPVVEGEADVTLVAGFPDVARVRSGKAVLVEHGAGQTYMRKGRRVDPSGDTRPAENVILYLAPNWRIAETVAARLPNAKVEVVGSAAVENLHWRMFEADHRKRITFAVHWPSPLGVPEAGSSWPWSERVLRGLIGEYGDRVLAHAHPRIEYRFRRDLNRFRLNVEYESDWDTAAAQTATLVCDNSSIVWEANAVGIPVALIDPPTWDPEAAHGLRFGPEAARFPRVEGRDVSAVRKARTVADPVYGPIIGATRRAVDAILTVA